MNKFNELNMPLELLSHKQLNDNQQLTLEYEQYIQMASLDSILFDKILTQNFQSALSVLHHLQIKVEQSNQQNYFHQLACYLQRLIPIIIICKMIPVQSIVNFQELELLQTYLTFQHFKNQISILWQTQISIMMNAIYENQKEPEIQKIIDQFLNNRLDSNLLRQIDKISNDVITQQVQLSAHYDIQNWSPNQQPDIVFAKLITSGSDLKINFKEYIKIEMEMEMKSSTYPLMKEEIEALIS